MNSIKSILQSKGISSEELDTIVDEAASQLGTNANNDGLKSQLEFLKTTCGISDEELWKRFLMSHLAEEGHTVDAKEPSYGSNHKSAFTGTVASIEGEYIVVRDSDNNHYEVEYSDIIDFH